MVAGIPEAVLECLAGAPTADKCDGQGLPSGCWAGNRRRGVRFGVGFQIQFPHRDTGRGGDFGFRFPAGVLPVARACSRNLP
jgi:hypothetical protein